MAASTSSGSLSLVNVVLIRCAAVCSALLLSTGCSIKLFHAPPPAWPLFPTTGKYRLFLPGRDEKTVPRSDGRTPSAAAPRSFFQGPCPALLRSGLWLPTEGSTRSRRPSAPA